jgi:hypothetical protein
VRQWRPAPAGSARCAARRAARRSGMATVLALLLLMVLATLAVGLVSAGNITLQQSNNIAAAESAQLQAESGLSYLIYQLNGMPVASARDANAILASVATHLSNRFEGAMAMSGGAVAYDPNDPNARNMVSIPNLSMGVAGNFSATITSVSSNSLRLVVTGRNRTIERTMGVTFIAVAAPGGHFALDYGIASNGPIRATGNVTTVSTNRPEDAAISSATLSEDRAIWITGNVDSAGDMHISNPDGEARLTGSVTIGGDSGPAAESHIHVNAPDPNLPEVDPEIFRHLATNVMDESTPTIGNLTFDNLYIPADMNPSFTGNVTIRGILFIEQPNRVRITGNAFVTGAIVTEDAGDGVHDNNYIRFTGNSQFNDVGSLPDESQFAELRQMPGASILAPGFGITMTGNFGTIAGWIAADMFEFTGNVTGTIRGGLINYGDSELRLTGNTILTFDRNDDSNSPPGFIATEGEPTLQLQANSYAEY